MLAWYDGREMVITALMEPLVVKAPLFLACSASVKRRRWIRSAPCTIDDRCIQASSAGSIGVMDFWKKILRMKNPNKIVTGGGRDRRTCL
ncbi:unnamed protein product [Victoria cruziana]